MSASATAAYDRLKHRFATIQHIRNAANILNRDMITAMPRGAAADRAGQLVALSALAHEKLADPQTAEDLVTAESAPAADPWDAANLKEMRRLYAHEATVPADLVAEATRLATHGSQNHAAWRRAGNWDVVRPHYDAIFAIKRQVAQAKQESLRTATPYDALIDEFDPGGNAARIAALFAPVESFLRGAIPQAATKHKPVSHPPAAVPLDRQERIFTAVAAAFGFDFTRGRLYMIDQHPSCYGTPDDQRFTTRADDDDFAESLRTVAHEVGHGLYEQNLPVHWRYQPVGQSVGMTIHESQSLFWEKQVARHDGFFAFLRPHTGDFSDPLLVEPSFIRVAADEMTYPMHIYLRFDIEQKLLDGSLPVADLPDAWAAGMSARLGIVPPDHTRGCLQDIHWACGDVGYFPSYALGAMTAAQLTAALKRDIPDFDDRVAAGDFAPLRHWLTEKIHRFGSLLCPADLIAQATGEPLNPAFFIDHLRRRYGV